MCDEYILKRIDMMFAGKKIPMFLQSFCSGRNEITEHLISSISHASPSS